MALGSNMKGKNEKQKPAAIKKEEQKKTTRQVKKAAVKPKPPATKDRVAKKKVVEQKPKKEELKKPEPTKSKKVVLIDLKNAEIILEPSKRKKIRKIRVFLEGELTINNVDAFMQRIHPVFKDYDYVDFSLRKVISLDLCFIQMLYHMKKNYGKKKKEVTVDSKLSSDLKKIIVQAGFEELMFIPKLV